MTVTQDPTEAGWGGRPLLADEVVLSEEQIARAAHCSDPADTDEAAWDRYLRALALEGIKSEIKCRNGAITIGPELEPEAPGRLLAVNGLATQLVCCSDLGEAVEVDLTPWRKQATAPQLLLAVQVEEDNGVVRVAGVMDGPSLAARIKQEGKTFSAAKFEVPVAAFTGGFDRFLRWATMLPAPALPRVAAISENSAMPSRVVTSSLMRLQSQLTGWVKHLLSESPTPLPLQVTGIRAMNQAEVCLINPRVELDAKGNPVAVSVSSTPTIWADRPMAEILIERDGVPVWQKLATRKDPIDRPIAWPLESMQPLHNYTLKLRPYGSLGGAYCTAVLALSNDRTLRLCEAWFDQWDGSSAPPATAEVRSESDADSGFYFELAARLQLKNG